MKPVTKSAQHLSNSYFKRTTSINTMYIRNRSFVSMLSDLQQKDEARDLYKVYTIDLLMSKVYNTQCKAEIVHI